MKRSKKIYLLLGILAVVCAATIGVMQVEEHKEKIKNTDEIILSVSVDSVQSLSWEYESGAFAFHRDEKWLYDEDEAFPVKEEKINRILEQFQEFGASFIIEEAEDLGQYGLDEPVCTIHLATEEQSYEVQLGSYNATDEELTAYGLDEPELAVTVAYLSEEESGGEISNTFVINISRSPEEKAADRETDGEDSDSEEEEITAYARVGESQIVYQISGDSYENLMAVSYDSLRHQEVFSADTTDIRQIDITLEGIDYTITSEEDEEDGRRIYYYQGKDVDMANFKGSLKKLNAVSFTKEQPAQKEEIRLVVYLDNENFPEVEIELYRYDGDECLAVVDGEPVSFVQRSAVVDLIEAVHGIVLNE